MPLRHTSNIKKSKGSIAITLLLFCTIMISLFAVYMRNIASELSTQTALLNYQQKQNEKELLKKVTQESFLNYYESQSWNALQLDLPSIITGFLDEINAGSDEKIALSDTDPLPTLPANTPDLFWANLSITAGAHTLDGNIRLVEVNNEDSDGNRLHIGHRAIHKYLTGPTLFSMQDSSAPFSSDPSDFKFNYKTCIIDEGVETIFENYSITLQAWQVPVSDFEIIAYSSPKDESDLNYIPTADYIKNSLTCPITISTQILNQEISVLISSLIDSNSPAYDASNQNLPYYYRSQMSSLNVLWDELWRNGEGFTFQKYKSSFALQLDAGWEDTPSGSSAMDKLADANPNFASILTGFEYDDTNKEWTIDLALVDTSIRNIYLYTDENVPLNKVIVKESTSARSTPLIIFAEHKDFEATDTSLKIYLTESIVGNTALFIQDTELYLGELGTSGNNITYNGNIYFSPNSWFANLSNNQISVTGSVAFHAQKQNLNLEHLGINRTSNDSLRPYMPRFLVTQVR